MNIKVVCIILLLVSIYIPTATAQTNWWNVSFLTRTDATPDVGIRPYQFSLNISNTTGTNNNTHVYCGGVCNVNFTDVRFILDNTTVLPHWIDVDSSKVWINVTNNGTVNMYYNNPDATYNNTQGGRDTFIAYDPATFTVNGSSFTINPNKTVSFSLSSGQLHKQINPLTDFRMRFGLKVPAWNHIAVGLSNYTGVENAAVPDLVAFRWSTPGGTAQILINAYPNLFSTVFTNPGVETWYYGELTRTGTTARLSIFTDSAFSVRVGTNTLTVPSTPMTNVWYITDTDSPGGAGIMDENMFLTRYSSVEPLWNTWSVPQNASDTLLSRFNSYTNNNSGTFTVLSGRSVLFNITTSNSTFNSFSWSLNGSVVAGNVTNYTTVFNTAGTANLNVTAYNIGNTSSISAEWNVTVLTYPLEMMTPVNGSSVTGTTVNLVWREWPSVPAYTYRVSTDPTFVNIIVSGAGVINNETVTANVTGLTRGTTYYWHVKNNTGSYLQAFNFTVTAAPPVSGSLNITVLNEETQLPITNINITIVNKTTSLSKVNSTGNIVNFSAAEVSAGEYTVFIRANESNTRQYIQNSPGTYQVYLTSTTASTSEYIFVLLDYTNLFPFNNTILQITKIINSSTVNISSLYFDSSGTANANLLNLNQYQLAVLNPTSSQTRTVGGLVARANQTMNLMVGEIKFKPNPSMNNLNYNITYNGNTSITLAWSDPDNELVSVHYRIQKLDGTPVHDLTTSVSTGQSTYIIENASAPYQVFANFTTKSLGTVKNKQWYDPSLAMSGKYTASIGDYPQWVYNAISMFFLFVVGLLFGRENVSRGGIVVSLLAVFMWTTNWLVFPIVGPTATLSILLVLLFISIIAMFSERDR